MNCARFSCRATSRTPSRPRDSLVRLCVRDGVGCSMFSLVGRLPSRLSADGCPPSPCCTATRVPFDSRVKYNVYSAFLIVAAHQRRHLWQAEQAIDSLRKKQTID